MAHPTRTRWLSTCSLVLLTLAALSGSALGQNQAGPPADTQPVADLDLEQLLNVEVQSVFGASKFLQKITEAPASVTVITAEEIRRFGYRNLADALRSVRGFFTTYDRIYAFAGVRGFQRPGDYNTRFLLLIDGFRANDNVYEQASIGDDFQLDLDLVERIEIVRGPSSSLYGSNAFFGVVNVVTLGARQLKTAASVETGSLGYLGVRARAGHVFANGAELAVAASSQELDGQRRLYFPELDAPETNGGVSNDLDWQNRKSVYASLGFGNVSVQAALTEREKGIPTGAYGMTFNDPRSSVLDRWGFVNVGYERRVGGATLRARGSFGASHYVGNMPYPSEDPESDAVLNRDVGDGTWWGGETTVSGSWRQRHRLSAGVEFRHNSRQDQSNFDVEPRVLYLDDRRRSDTWAWFGQDEINLGRGHLLNVGVRGDHYSDFDAPVMPRLAWIFAPTQTTTVKALYGQAFRAPSAYEIYYAYGDYLANVDLGPERIRTGEFVVEQYIGRRVRASANVFHYWVTGLIAQDVDQDGLLQYRNVGSAEATGVEFEVEGKWPGGISARVSVAAQDTTDRDTHERLVNSPTRVGQVALMFPLVSQRLLAGVDAHAVGPRQTKTGGTAAGFVSPNVTLLAPGLLGHVDLSFSVYNLSGTRYADPAADESPQDVIVQDGRTARLKATWRF